ncbi:MAG: hypothetical protein JWQ75_2476 [Pseudarthrobacter sp.]|nr:hypothetical protein [Pseudarthrobacter sp.]
MTTPDEEPRNTADLRGPGDPDEAAARRDAGQDTPPDGGTHHSGTASNIREEQGTKAAGTVPASYVGSGAPGGEDKPEDAVAEPGTWDDDV